MICGNFLVLIVVTDDANFIVDMVKFNDKEIFHFKRLTAQGDNYVYQPLFYGLPSRVYLDMEWQRFYIMSNYSLHCYGFTGEKMFEGSIRNYEVRINFFVFCSDCFRGTIFGQNCFSLSRKEFLAFRKLVRDQGLVTSNVYIREQFNVVNLGI